MMTVLIIIVLLIAVLLSLTGIVGAIVPALPGPPLSFASLLTVYFICPGTISTELLIWMLVLTIIVSVLDYVAPIWLTKVGGGSKAAIWGSTLGLIAGLLYAPELPLCRQFFMPIGLIVGPLAGAFFGEMTNNSSLGKATRVALMSFVSFLLTTGAKLVISALMTFYTLEAVYSFSIGRFFS